MVYVLRFSHGELGVLHLLQDVGGILLQLTLDPEQQRDYHC